MKDLCSFYLVRYYLKNQKHLAAGNDFEDEKYVADDFWKMCERSNVPAGILQEVNKSDNTFAK